MLPTKRTAGVTPEMNLRNLMHTEHAIEQPTLALKVGADVT